MIVATLKSLWPVLLKIGAAFGVLKPIMQVLSPVVARVGFYINTERGIRTVMTITAEMKAKKLRLQLEKETDAEKKIELEAWAKAYEEFAKMQRPPEMVKPGDNAA
jgi:hypothetical protein